MAQATTNNGFVEKWEFEESHLDPNITSGDGNVFVNAARCILYGALSDQNAKRSAFYRIGAVQSYQLSENKQFEPVFEIGSEIPYYVPGRTLGQISIQRILLSGEDMINLIYNDGSSSSSTYIPSLRDSRMNKGFDLLFAFYGTNKNGKFEATYSRLFKHCYIQSRSETLQGGQIVVAEGVSVVYEYISSVDFVKNKVLSRK